MMVYEDEIDLRKYIKPLLSRWTWIVGATLLLGVVAAAYSLLRDPFCEAKALVTVSPQPYRAHLRAEL
ncbi:MAG: Wzz/FepE/Etk N-terminal domain-containing protein [Anaerolineae bacterium]